MPEIALLGPLSAQMLWHLVLMNLLAPLLVLAARPRLRPRVARSWPLATSVQVLLLWGWHLPSVLERPMSTPSLHLAMQGSLFLAALWFWSALAAMPGEGRWRAAFALLVTGKLVCLLGALLVFAPRVLFGHGGHMGVTLADQQMAGLVMLVACPLTYVVAGVTVSALWFLGIEKASGGLHG